MQLAAREKALIGIALAVGAFVVFGPSGGGNTVEPRRESFAAGATPAARHGAGAAPRLDGAMNRLLHRVAGTAADAALFAAHSWYTPPPPPPPVPAPVVIKPAAPTAPPLPYQYMGSYLRSGGVPVFFLTRGDRTYDVKAGDTLDGTYTFDGLSGNSLVFTYKPLNVRQTLAADGAP